MLPTARARLAIVERADNQQHRVRAERDRLQQLVSRDDEVLAQERDVDCRAHLREVIEAPSKNVGSVSTEIAAAPAARIGGRVRGRDRSPRAGCRATASGACTRR